MCSLFDCLSAQVVVGGGGSKNVYLMERLAHHVNLRRRPDAAPIAVVSHEDVGMSSAAKEAMAFALLGFLAVHGERRSNRHPRPPMVHRGP